QILATDQARDRSDIGQRDRGINEGRLRAEPVRDLLLRLRVGADTGKGSRGSVMRSPFSDSTNQRLLHARILIQSEKTIGAEIDDLATIHTNGPIGTQSIHH